MYYENDSDETDTIIIYDTDGTDDSVNSSIAYSEEIQLYEDDMDLIQDENTQYAFDDISESLDNSPPPFTGEGIRPGQICIGTYKYIRRTQQFLYIMNIPIISFFKYNSYLISRYLYWHSSFYVAEHPPLDLIQLYETVENDSPYSVTYCVVKTYWIKIIQRVWRRVYRERRRILLGRSTLSSIKYRELNGYYPEEYRHMPRFLLFDRQPRIIL